jgi:electron transport complex protein RnfD
MTTRPLLITASPHLSAGDSTPKIMWTVVGTLVPIILASAWLFGVSALLVIAAATCGCVLTERAFGPGGALADGSAAITGILLGLTLPAGLPLWMAFVGGGFAIGCGKLVFGGLGQNIFNPALLGRAFLQAAFPAAMTTWPMHGGDFWQLRGDNFAFPFASPQAANIVTGASPLGKMKFEHAETPLWNLVIGSTEGSLGETSALLILLCGGYLAWRNYLNWRIPASIFLTVAVLSGALHQIDPKYPGALFMLFSGGLMLGAVYMATDLVTSPVTHLGCWAFGAGIGVLVVVIRIWGGLVEGVMYAVLLMNALVPYLNAWTHPRVLGARSAHSAVRSGS